MFSEQRKCVFPISILKPCARHTGCDDTPCFQTVPSCRMVPECIRELTLVASLIEQVGQDLRPPHAAWRRRHICMLGGCGA